MGITSVVKALIPRPVRAAVRRTLAHSQNLAVVRGAVAKYQNYLCRHYYGNTLAYATNVEGMSHWEAARRVFGQLLDAELHKDFVRVGYADLSSAANAATVRRLQQAFAAAISNPHASHNPFDDPATVKAYNHGNYQGPLGEYKRLITDVRTAMPGLKELFNAKLTDLIQSCLGSHFMIDEVSAYRNTHVPPHVLQHFEPHSSRWHFDDQLADRMRLFVYLTDVTAAHGPFECFDRAYSRFLLKQGFSKEARRLSVTGGLSPRLFDTPRLQKHLGPAGTMVLCASSFCLHRAGDMQAGNYRDALVFSLRPACAATSLEAPPSAA